LLHTPADCPLQPVTCQTESSQVIDFCSPEQPPSRKSVRTAGPRPAAPPQRAGWWIPGPPSTPPPGRRTLCPDGRTDSATGPADAESLAGTAVPGPFLTHVSGLPSQACAAVEEAVRRFFSA